MRIGFAAQGAYNKTAPVLLLQELRLYLNMLKAIQLETSLPDLVLEEL
jgi:hypothetical protein